MFILKKMFLIISCFIVILGLLFVYFYPQFYVCELIISFLPYIVFFTLFVVCIAFFLCLKSSGIRRILYLIIAMLFAAVFFLYAFKFNNYYTGKGFSVGESSHTGLDILYSNILYKTKNYDEINDWILQNNADLVVMVEFTDDFGKNMSEDVLEKYPYSSRVEYSDKYYGNVVFSKYPIKNLTQEIERGTWRYSYFALNYDGVDYYIYLVHTAAPVSLKHFNMRNKQLAELTDDYVVNIGKMTGDYRILVLGDFNLSPWSYYYRKLSDSLGGLYDLTKNYTILFTWAYRKFPLIASHIDHVFVDSGASVDFVNKVETPRSDHSGFFIKNFR